MEKLLEIYTDGTVFNSIKDAGGKMSIGVIFVKDKKIVRRIGKTIGMGHSTCAEYLAISYALQNIPLVNEEEVIYFYSDSKTIINEINLYSPKFISLEAIQYLKPNNSILIEIIELRRNFKNLSFKWIDRNQNFLAHAARGYEEDLIECNYNYCDNKDNVIDKIEVKYKNLETIVYILQLQVDRLSSGYYEKMGIDIEESKYLFS